LKLLSLLGGIQRTEDFSNFEHRIKLNWRGFFLRGFLNDVAAESDPLLVFLPPAASNHSPAIILFMLPARELSLPMITAVPPEMEVNIEAGRDDTTEISHFQAYSLIGNRETEVPIRQETYMKPRRSASQAGVQGQANMWVLNF